MKICPKCGTGNQDGSKFCENCGENLEIVQNTDSPSDNAVHNVEPDATIQGSQGNETAQKNSEQSTGKQFEFKVPKFNIDKDNALKAIKKALPIAIPVLAVVVVLIIGYSVLSAVNDPSKVIETYFGNIQSGNYEDNFDLLYFEGEETDLMNKEAYIAFCESYYTDSNSISQFTVSDSYYDDGLTITYDVSYTNSYSSTGTFSVSLIKQDKKSMLFFDTYKVASSDIICYNYQIYTIPGATVLVDGVNLSDSLTVSTETDDYYDWSYTSATIVIPALFVGEHSLQITHDLINDIDTSFYAFSSVYGDSDYDTGNYCEYSYGVIYTEDVVNALNQRSRDLVDNVLTTALAGKTLADTDTSITEGLSEEDYSSMTALLNQYDKDYLVSVTVSDEYSDKYDDGHYVDFTDDVFYFDSYISFNYDFTEEYEDYEDGEYVMTQEASSYTHSEEIEVIYMYQDGKWTVSSVESFDLYY